ncbi:MAG: phospholipid carrier-dependent glycosyltransferase [Solirubrobacterales bacterium]|nr:phospholipid carrier-dependent glycosyltransferase [Solirubrobacterales bacterium]
MATPGTPAEQGPTEPVPTGRPGPRRARVGRARARVAALLADPVAPLMALALIVGFSVGMRSIDLGQPCTSPCRASDPHTLIFDEDYYVNAARVIAGINPPAGAPYHGAPLGKDPNAEHPQLAKLVMAGGIELFGDNALGWRIGSVIFGTIALLALYALVVGAGGSGWLAAGATGVMALDNLLLVHGRIATLDIYVVAMMLVSGALYVRNRPLLAGLALGVAACMKEVGVYLAFVVILLEASTIARLRWGRGEGLPAADRARREVASVRGCAIFLASGALSFVGLLWLLDVQVPAYDPGRHVTYGGNPFSHIAHIYNYALLLTAKPELHGIASNPWEWLLNQVPINYAKVAVNTVVHGVVVASRATVYFRGEINPFVIFLAIPALAAAAADWWRTGERVAAVGVCWCLGAFLPFLAGRVIESRVTYLYYMVIVMPGVYIVCARLFARRPGLGAAAAVGWALALAYGFAHLYPLRTLL